MIFAIAILFHIRHVVLPINLPIYSMQCPPLFKNASCPGRKFTFDRVSPYFKRKKMLLLLPVALIVLFKTFPRFSSGCVSSERSEGYLFLQNSFNVPSSLWSYSGSNCCQEYCSIHAGEVNSRAKKYRLFWVYVAIYLTLSQWTWIFLNIFLL